MRTPSQLLLLAGVVGMTLYLFAQDPVREATGSPAQATEAPDAPGRAARLGLITGNVSFQPGVVEDWVPATPNRPLTTGDRLWIDTGGRAEVQLGSSEFRLDARTNFSFINLDDKTTQLQLSTGSLSMRVRRLEDDESVEIDTPQAALSILRPGDYRVDVTEQGDATVATVRGGQMEAIAGESVPIRPREQVRIMTPEGAPTVFDRRDAPPTDDFDNFGADRDRQEDNSQSTQYVSPDIPGTQDLDRAGAWQTTPEYGAVWQPSAVPAGWAPYHYGHWAWIAPWGWTWVDDQPWGYAPFHYGRWVSFRGGWAWVPGPRGGVGVAYVRPMYAPALVAWVGGPGFAVGIGGGAAVGWFPLGPREVFVPSYRYSAGYIERVNVTNTVIVNRTVFVNANVANVRYVNRGVAGAVVAMPSGAMVSGRSVGASAVVVRPEMMGRAQVSAYSGVAPEHGAVVGGRAASRYAPPSSVMARTVVTRNAPPPAPVAFEHQRAALAGNQGRPLDHQTMTQIRSTAPVQAQRTMYRPATNQGNPSTPSSNRQFTPQGNQSTPQGNRQYNPQVNTPGNPSTPQGNRQYNPQVNTQGNQSNPQGNRPYTPQVNTPRPAVNQPNTQVNTSPNTPAATTHTPPPAVQHNPPPAHNQPPPRPVKKSTYDKEKK